MEVVITCEDLRDAIYEFKSEVSCKGDFSVLFKKTYKKYPQVLAYLTRWSVLDRFLSLNKTVVNLYYSNTDIYPNKILHCNNKSEFIERLHECACYYRTTGIIVYPSDLDVYKIVPDTFSEYSGFYSNLTEHSFTNATSLNPDRRVIRLKLSYRIGSVMLGIMENAVDKEVERICKSIFVSEMSDFVKVYVAHNYLAKTVIYYNNKTADSLERSYLQSAYGALINKRCVCQGYAEAFKRILDYVGIKNMVISGKIKGSESYHAWNAVILNGKAYHVDVTWDSNGDGTKSNKYFCLKDSDFTKERLWSRKKEYICNGEENPLSICQQELFAKRARYIKSGVKREYLT